jgi:hypothetical protein
MNLYWIYDLPLWQFFLLTISVFIGFSLLGAFLFSRIFETKLGLTSKTNEIVSTFLNTSGVFYGITLGLISVANYENYSSVEAIVEAEASSLAALYRDVGVLEKSEKNDLQKTLKEYTRYIVEEAWPLQSQGIVPKGGTTLMDTFQVQLAQYLPETDRDKIIYSEVFDQFNVLIEKRRERLSSVSKAMPTSVWVVLLVGAFVNIVLTSLLVIDNRKLDIIINTLCGLLLGSLIFLIAAMDNPFRGEFSVSAEPFELLLKTLMK